MKYFAIYLLPGPMNSYLPLRFSNETLLKNWYLRPVSNVRFVLRVIFAVFIDTNLNEDISTRPPSKNCVEFLHLARITPSVMIADDHRLWRRIIFQIASKFTLNSLSPSVTNRRRNESQIDFRKTTFKVFDEESYENMTWNIVNRVVSLKSDTQLWVGDEKLN